MNIDTLFHQVFTLNNAGVNFLVAGDATKALVHFQHANLVLMDISTVLLHLSGQDYEAAMAWIVAKMPRLSESLQAIPKLNGSSEYDSFYYVYDHAIYMVASDNEAGDSDADMQCCDPQAQQQEQTEVASSFGCNDNNNDDNNQKNSSSTTDDKNMEMPTLESVLTLCSIVLLFNIGIANHQRASAVGIMHRNVLLQGAVVSYECHLKLVHRVLELPKGLPSVSTKVVQIMAILIWNNLGQIQFDLCNEQQYRLCRDSMALLLMNNADPIQANLEEAQRRQNDGGQQADSSRTNWFGGMVDWKNLLLNSWIPGNPSVARAA